MTLPETGQPLYNELVLHLTGPGVAEKDLAKSPSPRIFVSLAPQSLDAAEAHIEALGTSAPLGFELRLDYLRDHAGLEAELHRILSRLRYPQTIATCRRVEAGGHFEGSVEKQVELLAAAARAGCQWVDIEIQAVIALRQVSFKRFAPTTEIVIHHNQETTPARGAIYRLLTRPPV